MTSVENSRLTPEQKRRVVYAIILLSGAVFVSTLVLPVPASTARFIAVLSFGLMSGLWLSQLIHSI